MGSEEKIKNDKGKGGQPRKEKRGPPPPFLYSKSPLPPPFPSSFGARADVSLSLEAVLDWSGHSIHFRLVVLL